MADESLETVQEAPATDASPGDAPSAETSVPATASPRPGKRIALLGLGTVGSAVASQLLDPEWRASTQERGHAVPTLVGVAVRDEARARSVDLPDSVRVTTDVDALASADDVDIVVELMGGTDTAADAIRRAFAAGKPVVTANKELLARQGPELEAAAREAGVALRFEAAVAAGVPVLGPLVWDLGANRVTALRGIVNGTTNHILSTMAADARDYADVLQEAQARGYAESDPASDVEGLDAAYKLTLLARLAFGTWIDVDALRRSVPTVGRDARLGITGVRRADLSAAARLGMTIKLIARAERVDDRRDPSRGDADGGLGLVPPRLEHRSHEPRGLRGPPCRPRHDVRSRRRWALRPRARSSRTSSCSATTATPRRGSSCRRLLERRSKTTLPASVAGW